MLGQVPLPSHPIQRRWFAEDLLRHRRSDEERRFAASQRSGRIDANPHQVEAVIFALSRLVDGGCILADEVGLGKTIEAGLVIAQLRAEGARRILLITPKTLVGQWRQELSALFGISAVEANAHDGSLDTDGVLIIGREAAGSEKGKEAMLAAPAFDLLVIDEAHEIFGGLHKRFNAEGELREADVSRTAGRVFDVIRAKRPPVLLLTATPLQNSLAELWALVRFVDPNGTLLGDITTFRQTFCAHDDRILLAGQGPELQRRMRVVLFRTLRRQAQQFLDKPFVSRQARLFEYPMQADERSLYEDVTTFLMSRRLAAFSGRQRRLLLIGFHRRMASSTAALASSLEKVAERLDRMSKGMPVDDEALVTEFTADLDDEDFPELEEGESDDAPLTAEEIAAELAQVKSFIARARKLGRDGKSSKLLEAARLILERGRSGGSGKMVIFTESVVTQEYLRALLLESRLVTDEELTLFRGQNDSPRAKQALKQWWTEVGDKLGEQSRPSPDIAVRLALVHEFATRSKVLVSTEAGAKGLNLQFCDTVINYDLPWNPQRIEQRIGRCHRYGQTRDVTVINFLAKDNETERLTFDILAKKLELFGSVLDASDAVLHRAGDNAGDSLSSTLGADLETSLARIWERARTIADVVTELRELREKYGDARQRFDDEKVRTASLIETHFDEEVRRIFQQRKDEVPRALAALDADLERLVVDYLTALGAKHRLEMPAGGTPVRLLSVEADGRLPGSLAEGACIAVGASKERDSLHLSHPLVIAALSHARMQTVQDAALAIGLPADGTKELLARRGKKGRLVGLLVRYHGLEPVDRLLPIAFIHGENVALEPEVAATLMSCAMKDRSGKLEKQIDDRRMDDAIEEVLFVQGREVTALEESRFERSLEQLEHYIEDRVRLLTRQKSELEPKLAEARARRDGAVSPEVRATAEATILRAGRQLEELGTELSRLTLRDDETYNRCREQLHQRRYSPTTHVRLFDVAFVLE
jgi:hypothetical protein